MPVSDYEPLKEFLRIPPRDLTYQEVVVIFWSALEALDRQDAYITELEAYIDNDRAVQEIRHRCANQFFSTLRRTDS